MKFAKEWKTRVSGFGELFRKSAIDYKTWKKVRHDDGTLREQLDLQCQVADACFERLAKAALRNRRATHVQAALDFASLNRTCMTKLCKRFEKRGISPGIRQWIAARRHQYAFFGGRHIAAIQLCTTDAGMCPICFEDGLGTERECIILHCGHVLCTNCILNMIGYAALRGTTLNLIAHAQYHAIGLRACPLCRTPFPLYNLQGWQIVGRHSKGCTIT